MHMLTNGRSCVPLCPHGDRTSADASRITQARPNHAPETTPLDVGRDARQNGNRRIAPRAAQLAPRQFPPVGHSVRAGTDDGQRVANGGPLHLEVDVEPSCAHHRHRYPDSRARRRRPARRRLFREGFSWFTLCAQIQQESHSCRCALRRLADCAIFATLRRRMFGMDQLRGAVDARAGWLGHLDTGGRAQGFSNLGLLDTRPAPAWSWRRTTVASAERQAVQRCSCCQ